MERKLAQNGKTSKNIYKLQQEWQQQKQQQQQQSIKINMILQDDEPKLLNHCSG